MTYDVCVIGLGRVGLPLALSFAGAGLSVLGVDNDPDVLAALRERRMPFKEPGTDELLARVDLDLSHRAADGAQARAIVLTLGTPSFSHIEIDMGDIRSVLDDLLPHLAPEHLLVLRSTVAPGTTEFVAGYLEKHRGFTVSRSTAASRSARTSSSRTCPSGSPPTASWPRSAPCRASSAASARARPSARPTCSPRSARRSCTPRPCRPSWRRSGPTSSATPPSRSRTC
jgi:hypothetical protein